MKMSFQITTASALLVLCAAGFAQALPDVPENLQVPSGEKIVLIAHATGVQIYTCQENGDHGYAWVLKSPEAELTDKSGKIIIHHFAGPAWKSDDGSEVTGKLLAKHDAPVATAIPWLLLSAASHSGEGVLTHVTSIQRIHTVDGLAPQASDCAASKDGQESRSKYSADYYFYAPTKP